MMSSLECGVLESYIVVEHIHFYKNDYKRKTNLSPLKVKLFQDLQGFYYWNSEQKDSASFSTSGNFRNKSYTLIGLEIP